MADKKRKSLIGRKIERARKNRVKPSDKPVERSSFQQFLVDLFKKETGQKKK